MYEELSKDLYVGNMVQKVLCNKRKSVQCECGHTWGGGALGACWCLSVCVYSLCANIERMENI